MKKIWTKYNGVIFLYSVIIFGILAMNTRFKYLQELEMIEERNAYIAVGE